ncbi:MAG: alpha/beta hydrolase [Neptuniibacter caesariensis]|uniref:Alpha/beta hydrolase n=1 Tax=Neptuniibacter caesariensis TaxID=207954 RepID=A0A2G6JN96_NEPCE|nr:MAG: alpha/beta hydrolase [Neptuniibacter caesariensis]
MLLNYQVHGEGSPLLILHGLFGTLENWGTQIKRLSQNYQVIAADMRDHGRSPHSEEISYTLMAEDIRNLMDHLNLDSAHIIGHSMGGKAAMQFALTYPDRVNKLIIVDIAPVLYSPHHDDVFKGLFSVNLASLKSRSDADKQLTTFISDSRVRAFLLKNLYRAENGEFKWRMNLALLHNQYTRISAAPKGEAYAKPVLFIKGAKSDYLIPEYRDAVLSLFPKSDYRIIRDAGHWPHAEKPAEFTDAVLKYLQ